MRDLKVLTQVLNLIKIMGEAASGNYDCILMLYSFHVDDSAAS